MDQSSPNLKAVNPYRLTSFFPIVDLICSFAEIFSVKVQIVPKSDFRSKPVGGRLLVGPKHPGDLGPNFSNNSSSVLLTVLRSKSLLVESGHVTTPTER